MLLLTSTQEAQYRDALLQLDRYAPIVALQPAQLTTATQLCEQVQAEQGAPIAAVGHLHLALVSYLNFLMQRQAQSVASPVADAEPYQYLKYLQLHHQAPLSLATLSQVFAVDADVIEQSLQALTGFGFSALLNQVRIRNAVGLMQYPGLSLRQIASICGYPSLTQMSTQFKHLRGVSPQAYRKQQNGAGELLAQSDNWRYTTYLFEHCREQLTLPDLAQALHCSEDVLTSAFTEMFGMSFKPLLNQFRCQQAQLLLQNLDWSVQEVASAVGYTDAQTFARNYRRVWGVTPKQAQMQARA